MRRWALLIGAGLLGAAAAVVPALGANQTVTLSGQSFSPATVTVNAGEMVTFQFQSGTHNVTFDDPSIADVPDTSSAGQMVARQFPNVGTYSYACTLHAPDMIGTVVVNAAPPGTTTPPGGTPPPTGTSPSTGPTQTTPGTGTPPPATATAPTLGARRVSARNCTRRSAKCRRPGIRIRVTASDALTVTGQLQRRARRGGYRASGRVRFAAPKGTSAASLLRRVDRSRIGPGDYRVTLTAVRSAPGSNGIRSAAVVLRFSVRG